MLRVGQWAKLLDVVLLQHLVSAERLWDLGAFEQLQTADLMLLCLVVKPQVVEAETEACCLVISSVNEALSLVVRSDLALQLVGQFVLSQVEEAHLALVVVFPQFVEDWFELSWLSVAVHTLEILKVKLAFHFQPRLDLGVVQFQFSL